MSLLSRRPFLLDGGVALEISAETLSQRTYVKQKTNYTTNKQKPKAKFLVISAHKTYTHTHTHTHTRNKTLG
jgi:hypothetical protein